MSSNFNPKSNWDSDSWVSESIKPIWLGSFVIPRVTSVEHELGCFICTRNLNYWKDQILNWPRNFKMKQEVKDMGRSIGLSISPIRLQFKELQLRKPRCELTDTVNKYTAGKKRAVRPYFHDTQCAHSEVSKLPVFPQRLWCSILFTRVWHTPQ